MGARVRTVLVGVAALLLAVACGDNDALERGEVTLPPETTAPADASTTTGIEPTTTTSNAPAAVQPTVLCITNDVALGVAYFGYENDGATVEIPVGADNRIGSLSSPAPATLAQTTVFASGGEQLAAWTEVDEVGGPVTWTIVGPDGEERSATATLGDPSIPECGDDGAGGDVLPVDPPDTRAPAFDGAVEVALDGSTTVTISLAGLDAESRCPQGPGWTPDEPEVFIDAFPSINVELVDQPDPSIAVVRVLDPNAPADGTVVRAEGFANVRIAADVTDHCHDADGNETAAWAGSPTLLSFSQFNRSICFAVLDDPTADPGYGAVDCTLGPVLAETGGIRTR